MVGNDYIRAADELIIAIYRRLTCEIIAIHCRLMVSNQTHPLALIKRSLHLAHLRKHRVLLVLTGDDSEYLPQIYYTIRSAQLECHHMDTGAGQQIVTQLSNDMMHVPERHSNSDNSDQINALLGTEHMCLIFDAHGMFQERLFAACAGTVLAGGILVLRTPALNEWAKEVGGSEFVNRLIRKIQNHQPIQLPDSMLPCVEKDKAAAFLIADNEEVSAEVSLQITEPAWKTEQDSLLQQLLGQWKFKEKSTTVLQADRGRGKSTLIGRALRHLLPDVSLIEPIHITASRQRACDVLQQHAGVTTENQALIRFVPIERALEIKHGLLIVEEAGSISIPVLTKLTEQSRHIVFATTVHGYEGAGRGFALRFSKELDRLRPGWVKLQPIQPIRWSPNDPLEAFVNDALLLKTKLPQVNTSEELKPSLAKLVHIEKHELSNNDALLEEIYSLLIQAHYQTTPADLRHMLDQKKLLVFAQRTNNLLTGAALVALEGDIPLELHEAIVSKERRLADQILPQLLAQSAVVPTVLALRYARVVRIAVHPKLHRRGFGTALFEQLRNQLILSKRIIGASFGADQQSISFWLKLGFTPVHYGYKINARSGLRSACVLMGGASQATLAIDKAMKILHENLVALDQNTIGENNDNFDQVRRLLINATNKPNIALTTVEKTRLVTDFCQSKRSFNDTVGFIKSDDALMLHDTVEAHLHTLLHPDNTLRPKQRRRAEQALREAISEHTFF